MRRALRQSAILLILPLVPAAICAFVHPKRPGWDPNALRAGEVRFSTVEAWSQGILWIDARSRKEYQKDHVPDALFMDEGAWDDLLPDVLQAWSPDKRIVVYCDSRSCQSSHEVARRLKKDMGIEEVYVLKGGWDAWTSQKKN